MSSEATMFSPVSLSVTSIFSLGIAFLSVEVFVKLGVGEARRRVVLGVEALDQPAPVRVFQRDERVVEMVEAEQPYRRTGGFRPEVVGGLPRLPQRRRIIGD